MLNKLKNNALINAILIWVSIVSFFLLQTKTTVQSIVFCLFFSLITLVLIIKYKESLSSLLNTGSYIYIYIYIIIAGIFVVDDAIEFYNRWLPSSKVAVVSVFFDVDVYFLLTIITIILSLISLLSIAMLIRILCVNIFGINKDKLLKYQFLIKPFLIIFAIYAVGFLAIYRANFKYIDDLGRTLEGYKGWNDFSRFFSIKLSTIVNGSYYLTDISPLTQLIAIILLAISGAVVLHLITNKKSFNTIDYFAIIPFGLSPYFLSCLSYKFDSPYMAFSIFASVMPAIFVNDNTKKYSLFLTSLFGTILVCNTYQVSTGIFPMLIVTICFVNAIKGNWAKKEIINVLLKSSFGYILGIIVYRFIIMVPTNVYVSNTIPNINSLVQNVLMNYSTYFSYILNDFPVLWIVIILIIMISFVVNSTAVGNSNKLIIFVCSLVIEFVLLMMMFGLYPVLEKPLFSPRAMYGVGVFISLIELSAINFNSSFKSMVFSKLSVIVIGYLFFTFAFTYGNALYEQNNYVDYRTYEIANDLNNLLTDDKIREIQIKNSVSFSPVVKNEIKHYPILERLVPINLREGNWWGVYEIANYYDLPIVVHDLNDDLSKINLPILSTTSHYVIKGNEKYVLVELK